MADLSFENVDEAEKVLTDFVGDKINLDDPTVREKALSVCDDLFGPFGATIRSFFSEDGVVAGALGKVTDADLFKKVFGSGGAEKPVEVIK